MAGVGGRGMACHARPCGEATQGGGGLTSLTSRGMTTPPPPEIPAATPAEWSERAERSERAEPAAGRGQRGAVHEWVEQQQQLLQWAGAWETRALSAEAANRDPEARLSRANEDRRAAELRLADVTKERDRLATKVQTLERDLGTTRKAAGPPAKPPAQTGEGAGGAEGPPGERAGWGGGGQCRRCPVPFGRRTGLSCPGPGMRRPDVRRVHRPADSHDGHYASCIRISYEFHVNEFV